MNCPYFVYIVMLFHFFAGGGNDVILLVEDRFGANFPREWGARPPAPPLGQFLPSASRRNDHQDAF
jgi:hypothetical protein